MRLGSGHRYRTGSTRGGTAPSGSLRSEVGWHPVKALSTGNTGGGRVLSMYVDRR